MRRLLSLFFVLLCVSPVAYGHVGSPDVYVQLKAGPYPVFISVHPPDVLPGVATVLVHSEDGRVTAATVSPTLMTGEASKHPPTPEALQAVSGTHDFAGSVWIMSAGSWEVRFSVKGAAGSADVAVPLPSTATKMRGMQRWMGAGLALVGMLLVAGMVGIFAAAVRESSLEPGQTPTAPMRRKAAGVAVITLVVLMVVVAFGGVWWRAAAADYSEYLYKPLGAIASVSGNELTLRITDPGWLASRRLDDLQLDHNHLMHLYAVRWPAMDAVFHLHPEQVRAGEFRLNLPSMPAGEYRLYGDIVHANGFAETITPTMKLGSAITGKLGADDAAGMLATVDQRDVKATEFTLPDGFRMRFDRPAAMEAKHGLMLRFALLDNDGKPATRMEPYMGMAGHAAILKTDGTVFAHIHPEGSVAMAAYMMANAGAPGETMTMPDGTVMPMSEMGAMHSGAVTNEVAFPYGFPAAGRYRVVVQMKHAGVVETAGFDVDVR